MASRACAALTALWLVACGVLGLRHHAQVQHVREANTGAWVHASSMTGHHDRGAVDPDMHGRPDAGSHDSPCTLGLLQDASASWASPAQATAVAGHTLADRVAMAPGASRAGPVFRLAPKTSPPVA